MIRVNLKGFDYILYLLLAIIRHSSVSSSSTSVTCGSGMTSGNMALCPS